MSTNLWAPRNANPNSPSSLVIPPDNGLQALNRLSPLAPPVYGGVQASSGSVDFTYPYDNTLVGGVTGFQDFIKTNTDADFQMTALVINSYTSVQFSLQININGVYNMMNGFVLAANLIGDPSAPFPILGKFIIPRGADINLLFNELSGVNNTIEILIRGMKLYQTGS